MKKILLSLILMMFVGLSTQASHLMGADISYQYLYSDATNDYYQVTLTLYRDCSGISVSTSQSISMNSPSGCGSTFSQSLPLVGTATEVSPLCPSQLSNSTCNGGTIIGVEQYIFQDIVGFPTKCDDWNISFYQCCRNDGGAGPPPHNLTTPASWDLYVESTLDNTGSLNNNSPQFTSLPVPYICAGQPFTYNHGAFDPDGDSIVYTMIAAQDGPYPGTNIGYNAPATPTNPIVGAANIFDGNTGSIWVNPDGSDELAVMAVLVEEYRNGVLIGTTMRDLQVVVQSCSNVQPQDGGPNGGFDVVTGDGAIVDSNSIEVCPNGYVEFEVVYEDPNATDDITLMTNIATVIPGASFTQSGTNPATGVFTWTPTAADVGFHNFTITVQDDGCPILGSQVYAFDIDVLTRTFTEPDQVYCNSGGPLDITASGGSVFTWTTLSGDGLGCTSCATTTGAPTTSGTYEVTSDLSGTCKNKDTITITRVNDVSLSMSSDPTICKYGSAAISVTASPGAESPFTYSWTGDSLTDNTISGPTANPLVTTTYPVLVTSAAGCRMIDSVTVIVSGVAPNAITTTNADSLCAGEPAQLLTQVVPDVCGINTSGCSSTTDYTVGTGTLSSETYTPFYDCWDDYRIQILYDAATLRASGMNGNTITDIAFNVASVQTNGPETYSGFNVRMGCSDLTNLTSTFIPGLTQVYTGGMGGYTPSGTGWNNITLDDAYDWDGTSSLIVEICWDNSAYDCSSSSLTYYHTTTGITFLRDYAVADAGCNLSTPLAYSARPNIRFTGCEPDMSGLTFSWNNGGTLNNASIAEPIATPSTNTTYTLSVTDAGCTGTDQVTVNVSPAINTTITPDESICYGDNTNVSVTASGSSGYSYTWTPSNSLASPSSSSSSATPLGTTKYYVDVNAGFCTVRDSVEVTVAGGPVYIAASADSICPGDPVTLSATKAPVACGPSATGCAGTPYSLRFNHGTSNSYTYGPFYRNTSYTDSRYEYIITAAELTGLGFSAGTITGISVTCNTKNTIAPYGNVRIALSCTNLNEYPSTGYTFQASTLVYGPQNFTTAIGKNTFVFDQPYDWDGVSNLAVQFCYDMNSTDSYDYFEYGLITGSIYRTIRGYATTGMGCGLSPTARYYYRPNFEFDFCSPPSAPTAGITWTGSSLSSTTTTSTNASPTTTTTYTLDVVDPLAPTCPSNATIDVAVDATTVTAAADNTVRCTGDIANITTTLSDAIPADCDSYTLSSITFASPPSGGWITAATVSGCDDCSQNLPLGFSFNFYCTDFTTVNTSSNGFLSFTSTSSSLSEQTLPSTTVPNDVIAVAWDDLNPGTGGSIRYKTVGTAPNRIFYIQYYGVNHYGSTTQTVNAYVALYETTNVIEIHNINVEDDADGMTQGIENGTGTIAVPVTGRNNGAVWNAAGDAWRFTPDAGAIYTWTPATGLDDPTSSTPVYTAPDNTTRDFIVTVTGGLCTLIDTVTIGCVLANENVNLVANQNGDYNTLDWTSSLENVESYIIERSVDGDSFKKIGERNSTGTKFTFNDMKPAIGTNQYRIKCITNDPDYQYSNTVSVDFISDNVTVYPNPTNSSNSVFISFESEASKLDIELIDLLGQKVKSISTTISGKQSQYELDVADLPVGTYMYKVNIDGRTTIGKLVLSN